MAFAEPPKKFIESMFLFNRFVDSIFLVDMVLQFMLIYQVAASGSEAARWEDNPRRIARHYLCTWFFLDLISILPFDVLSIVVGEALAKLKIVRLFRLMRLIKLIRLIRASRMFKRWETRMAIDYSTLSLVRCMVMVCVGAHWFACTWSIIAGFADSPLDTWMGYFDYCWAAENERGYQCVDPWDMYAAALYFAMMTITSIGYGDLAATPKNASEQGAMTIMMLFGGMLWSNVVATFCGVIANSDPDTAIFHSTMDSLNRFMVSTNIPKDMQMRLREYFHQSKHLADTVTRRNLLDKMSPQLAGEVALQVNEKWLRRVWFLNGAGQEFVVQIALQLEAMVFTIGEVINNGYLYIINRGIALFGGRVLTAGSVWGEDMLLDSQWLVSKFCARAMTYLEVYTISREQLMDAARPFPYTTAHLRRCAIRLAVRREFIRLSKLAIAERQTELGEKPIGEKIYLIDKMLDKASGIKKAKQRDLGAGPLSSPTPPAGQAPLAERPPPPDVARRITQNEAGGAGLGEAGEASGEAVDAVMQTMARLEKLQASNHQLAASEFARLEQQQERMAKQVADQFASLHTSLAVLLRRSEESATVARATAARVAAARGALEAPILDC